MNTNSVSESNRAKDDEISEKQIEGTETINKKAKSKKCLLITSISIIVVIIIIGVVAYFFLKKIFTKDKKDKEEKAGEEEEKEEEKEETNIYKMPISSIPSQKIKEFDIMTRPGDLKQISVVQKSKDETKIDNKIIETENIRKTDYHIYIISEEDPDEEHNAYYTKMYRGCVSIRSECSSNNGDCELQPLVDLTLKHKKESNARALEDSDSDKIKDNPIALCFFNITDTHIITTIKCHEAFPESEKNQILLDLYFFRPPASKRIDKQADNITLEISEDGKHIREINGGLCNIYNNFGSLCTTDMNTI